MRSLARKGPPLSGTISGNVLKRNVKEMRNEMARLNFPRIQSEIKLGAVMAAQVTAAGLDATSLGIISRQGHGRSTRKAPKIRTDRTYKAQCEAA